MLDVLIGSPDNRIVTPAELLADSQTSKGGLDAPGADDLADEVFSKFLSIYRQRNPCRQTYSEQLTDWDGNRLRPTRYPIEGTPVVWLGGEQLTTGLYRVEGRCRHELRRDPNVSYAIAATGIPLSSAVAANLAPFETGGSTNAADFRLPYYVAGYVPPGSIGNREDSTAYNPNDSTSYGASQPGWIRHPDPEGLLLFECTTAGTSDSSAPTFPLSMAEWSPNITYTARQWLAPPTSLLVFEPTTPGTSGTEEPAWPTTAGETVSAVGGAAVWTARAQMDVTDGTVTWTGRNALEMPRTMRKAGRLMARILRTIELAGQCDKYDEKMAAIMHLLHGAC